jgi:hypothetical protein
MNPYQSLIDELRPRNATHSFKKRRAAIGWITVILPPLAMLAAIGLGVYINSLTLGPSGFFFVLILIGPGAWAIALACAAGVVAFLSQGSIAIKIVLWSLEIALCALVHSQVVPLLGGWG